MPLKILAVFGLGIVELWAAVPAGFALGIDPVIIGLVSAVGATVGVILIVSFGERVRAWFVRRYDIQRKRGRQSIARRIWDRWGIIGLGLLAPLITGAPLGAIIGLVLGVAARRLLLWMIVGVVVWSALLTLFGVLGLAGIRGLQ